MNDQYGYTVPDDLVALNDLNVEDLLEEELKKIDQLDWYVPDLGPGPCSQLIFVSADKLAKCLVGITDFTGPEDYDLNPVGWLSVDHCLHRWEKDYFYHA